MSYVKVVTKTRMRMKILFQTPLWVIPQALCINPQGGLEQNLHPHPRLRYYLHVAHLCSDPKGILESLNCTNLYWIQAFPKYAGSRDKPNLPMFPTEGVQCNQ